MNRFNPSFFRPWRAAALATALLLATACAERPAEPAKNAGQTPSGGTGAGQTAAVNPAATDKPKQWSSPPAMSIDPAKSYSAVIETTEGPVTVSLFAKDAPKTVNNFVFLSKEGFYDNVVFHRIIPSFMIQTGDPTGTGRGGPGYKFEDELGVPRDYDPGIVAMANSGPNTNGSQFFICTENCTHLNQSKAYSIFGEVTEGMEVVGKIAATKLKSGTSFPAEDVRIKAVRIEEK